MRLFTVILCLCSFTLLVGQKKVIQDGEACYLHVVEKGNTLYGISKQYAISIPSILDFNPEAKIGLSIGQNIFIPLKEVSRREAKRSPEMEGNVLIHKVARGETLYSLSRKYSVNEAALFEANPGLREAGLKKGATINIPIDRVKVEESLVAPAMVDSLVHHEVIQGETLYSLSKNYEVEIEEIKEVNGGLIEGLRAGMTLRLPIRKDGGPIDGEPVVIVKEDEPIAPIEFGEGVQFDIGLLLPFALGIGDTVNAVIPRGNDDIMKLTDIAFEFYRGAQIALDELSEKGLSSSVSVVDVSDDKKHIDQCLKRNDLKKVDLMIGPLHKDAFESLSSDGKFANVFRVSPLSSSLGKVASNDPNASQIKPSDEELLLEVVRDIKKNHANARVVLLSSEKGSLHKAFKDWWNVSDTTLGILNTAVLKELVWNKNAQAALVDALDPNGANVIVFPVADRPAITDLMAKLATTAFRNHDITLYGMEQWMRYENLDADVLERVNLHIPASSFVDYADDKTIAFIKEFQDRFETIPSSTGYALLAYDITMYYMQGLMAYGDEFLNHQDQLRYEGLSTGFLMRSSPSGAWVNDYGIVLEYKDHDFIRVD